MEVTLDRIKTVLNLPKSTNNIQLFDSIIGLKKERDRTVKLLKQQYNKFQQEKETILGIIEELKDNLKEKQNEVEKLKKNNKESKLIYLLNQKEDKIERLLDKYQYKKQKFKFELADKDIKILNLTKIVERLESGGNIQGARSIKPYKKKQQYPHNLISTYRENESVNSNAKNPLKNIFKSKMTDTIEFSLEDKTDMQNFSIIEELDSKEFDFNKHKRRSSLKPLNQNPLKQFKKQNTNCFNDHLNSSMEESWVSSQEESKKDNYQCFKEKLREQKKMILSFSRIINAKLKNKESLLVSILNRYSQISDFGKHNYEENQNELDRLYKLFNMKEQTDFTVKDTYFESNNKSDVVFIEEELIKEKYSVYEKETKLRNMEEKISDLKSINNQLLSKINETQEELVFNNIKVVQSSIVEKSKIQKKYNINPSQFKNTKKQANNSCLLKEDGFMEYESQILNIFNKEEVSNDYELLNTCYKNFKKVNEENFYNVLGESHYDNLLTTCQNQVEDDQNEMIVSDRLTMLNNAITELLSINNLDYKNFIQNSNITFFGESQKEMKREQYASTFEFIQAKIERIKMNLTKLGRKSEEKIEKSNLEKQYLEGFIEKLKKTVYDKEKLLNEFGEKAKANVNAFKKQFESKIRNFNTKLENIQKTLYIFYNGYSKRVVSLFSQKLKKIREVLKENDVYKSKLYEYHEILANIGETLEIDFSQVSIKQVISELKELKKNK